MAEHLPSQLQALGRNAKEKGSGQCSEQQGRGHRKVPLLRVPRQRSPGRSPCAQVDLDFHQVTETEQEGEESIGGKWPVGFAVGLFVVSSQLHSFLGSPLPRRQGYKGPRNESDDFVWD